MLLFLLFSQSEKQKGQTASSFFQTVTAKVISLRGDDIGLGRRDEFQELRRLRRWNENVKRWLKATENLLPEIPSTRTDVITP